MNQEILNQFKEMFQKERDLIVSTQSKAVDEIQVSPDDLADETDFTSSHMSQTMTIRLQRRSVGLLKKIDAALKRIDQGEFGQCEECDEEIGMKRLQARPTASLCIHCKEAEERQEKGFLGTGRPITLHWNPEETDGDEMMA